MHDGDSLFIRIVADRVEVQDERPVEDLLSDYRAFGKIEITGLVEGNENGAGTREISDDLLAAVENMPARDLLPAPEVAAAAIDPNASYIAYDVQMTEAQAGVTDTLAKASFELNYDVASRTVSIDGEFSDLSSSATMIHLHGADGGVIQGLSLETEDGLNGTFSGEIVLSAAQAAEFLAGDTYVNLHTQNNPGGELQGQVEVYAAGDFVLDRYESTSDTTVVTDDMARWSEAETWGNAVVPGADDIVVIDEGQTVVLDETTLVKGIIVNGGELIIEDDAALTIELSTDYLLVVNGGLFQAGTEDDLLDTNFTLTLEGDDPDMDLEVGRILMGMVPNTVFADVSDTPVHDHETGEEPTDGEMSMETGEEDHAGHEMPMDEGEEETDDQMGEEAEDGYSYGEGETDDEPGPTPVDETVDDYAPVEETTADDVTEAKEEKSGIAAFLDNLLSWIKSLFGNGDDDDDTTVADAPEDTTEMDGMTLLSDLLPVTEIDEDDTEIEGDEEEYLASVL